MTHNLSKTPELDALTKESSEKSEHHAKTDRIAELIKGVKLFHTPGGDGYATIEIKGHQETWALKSKSFITWLQSEYFRRFKSALGSQVLKDALGALEGKARFEGENHEVHLRVTEYDGKVYVDLVNPEWEVVEISESGWSVIKNPPVRFRRSSGALALPKPIRPEEGFEIGEFREFINVGTDEDFKLAVAWLIQAFNPSGPYLVLVVHGEQGSAKSSTVKFIRDLIDPNDAPLRRAPKGSDDLMVSAKGNWILAFDNMSRLQDWLSDDLCCVATGAGLAKRGLYTDDEECVLKARRPIILNGIDEFVTRGDLASRTVTLHLPVISGAKRKREVELASRFAEIRPRLLAILFDAISMALRERDRFALDEQLRMADAWHWVSAAAPALGWERGAIVDAFKRNQIASNEVVLEDSIIASGIRSLAEIGWYGTATDLLGKLKDLHGQDDQGIQWPKNPKRLSDELRRLSPAFRGIGIELNFSKEGGDRSRRMIDIKKTPTRCDVSDASTPKQIHPLQSDAGDDGVALSRAFKYQDDYDREGLLSIQEDDGIVL